MIPYIMNVGFFHMDKIIILLPYWLTYSCIAPWHLACFEWKLNQVNVNTIPRVNFILLLFHVC